MLLFKPEDFGEEASAALALYVKQQLEAQEAKKLMDSLRYQTIYKDMMRDDPTKYKPSHGDAYDKSYQDAPSWYKEPSKMYDKIEAIIDNYPSIKLQLYSDNHLLINEIIDRAAQFEIMGPTNKAMIVNPTKKIMFIKEIKTHCELWGIPLTLYDAKWISENWHYVKELMYKDKRIPLPPGTNNAAFQYHAKTYTMADAKHAQEYYDYQSRINT